jgi:hypothetical protein
MTWLHPSLLLGLGLVALPVLLHLLMRQKPKKLVFPALRLVQQRKKQTAKRFRLRHIWLLLLRMAALAALVAAIARPTLPGANYNLNLRETLTLLAVVAAGVITYYVLLRRSRNLLLPRHEFTLRRARLRGWTTGLTLLLALLLTGWPYQRRIAAEITSPAPSGQFDLPVAAVFVFDTSLSMQYTQEGKTRLDAARNLATEHLQDFPSGSRVAIAENATDNPMIFQASMSAAQSRLDSLALSPLSLPLEDRLRAAINLQRDDRGKTVAEMESAPEAARRDRFIRRIYLFTDLSASAWRSGGSTALAQALEQFPGLTVQIVDVGDLQPRNTSLRELRLSRQRIPEGGTLVVSADLASTGQSGPRKAILSLTSASGASVPRETQENVVEDGGLKRFDFAMLNDLKGPVVHGEVRLESSDPMKFDDVRSFTVNVGKPPKVLVVSPTVVEGEYLLSALDPTEGRGGGLRFEPVRIEPGQLGSAELSEYDVVYLVDVVHLADPVWSKLGTYVEQGGGLAVVLGSTEIDSTIYNRGVPQQFLPGQLDVHTWHSQGDIRFSIDQREHPLFWRFRQHESYGTFATFENDISVRRFWKVQPAAGASVLATYTDAERSPSLLERPHGKGRVVMFTTAVHLPDNERNRWNNLASPNMPAWVWLAFVEQMTEYLARTTDLQFNVLAGESVTLPVPPSDQDREYLLRRPEITQSRKTVPAEASTIVIDETDDVGNYELAAVGQSAPLAGFSVNPRSEESDLTRLTPERLEELFGTGRFQIARTLEEIKTDVNVTDLGKEVFPLVLLLAILAFCGEHFVANWFYEVDNDSRDRAPALGRGSVRPGSPAAASNGMSIETRGTPEQPVMAAYNSPQRHGSDVPLGNG